MRKYFGGENVNKCLKMCFTPFACFAEFLPYLILVTLPFFGSFSGIELILRLSLLLLCYVTVTEVFPKYLYYVFPYLQLCVMCALVVYLPMSAIPYPVIWVYQQLLWLLEPILLMTEMVLALNFVMHCSRKCAENIEEDEEEAWKWKLVITVFSASCYALLAVLVSVVYTEGSNIQFWVVVFVLSFSVMLAAHNMMWMSHQGIVSDVAFVTLSSMVIVYAMKEEIAMGQSPLLKPSAWYSKQSQGSLLTETYKILHTSIEYVYFLYDPTSRYRDIAQVHRLSKRPSYNEEPKENGGDNAQIAILYLKRFLSPLFMCLLGLRLYSIIFLVHRAIRNFGLETEESYIEDLESETSPWRSPLLVKCAIVILITQYTVRLYQQCSIKYETHSWVYSMLPEDILVGRILQVVLVNSFYIWRLYCADDWQWHDWFSTSSDW